MPAIRGIIALAGALLVVGAASTVDAAKRVSRASLEHEEASELIKMFDADKNGVVSKDEFLTKMGEVFDLLDTNKNRQLEPSELRRLPGTIQGLNEYGDSCFKASPPPRCFGPYKFAR